jgi:hypothetical protein
MICARVNILVANGSITRSTNRQAIDMLLSYWSKKYTSRFYGS